MKGKIEQWKDDKGFGFIRPDNGSGKIFFHISSVKTNERRPRIGDMVHFDSTQDTRQRLKAENVVIEGVSKAVHPSSKNIPIEPPRKNLLDYILILVCICSLAAAGFAFLRSGIFLSALVYGAPAVIVYCSPLRLDQF